MPIHGSLPAELRATYDRNGTPDPLTTVTLLSGASILDANFGFQVGLPRTGADVGRIAVFGILVTLLGAALVVGATWTSAAEGQSLGRAGAHPEPLLAKENPLQPRPQPVRQALWVGRRTLQFPNVSSRVMGVFS